MKQIYVYNNKNVNEFLFTKWVQDSYVTLPPVTEIQPPPKDEGYVWLFDQDLQQWNGQIVDYRGRTVYNKKDSLDNKVVAFVGVINEDYTLETPPDNFESYYYLNGEWKKNTVVRSFLIDGNQCELNDGVVSIETNKPNSLVSLDENGKISGNYIQGVDSGNCVKKINGQSPDDNGNITVDLSNLQLGDFYETINGTSFSTDYNWQVGSSSNYSDLLLEIMTRFDADQAANAIRHEEFDNRLIALEENTSSGTSNITVNSISPDETGNIVLTSDDIISKYSDGSVSITQQLQYFKESIEQQLKDENYVKTVNGTSPDDYGNVQLDLDFVTSVNGQTGQVTGIVQTVDSLTPDENGNIDLSNHILGYLDTTNMTHNWGDNLGEIIDNLTSKTVVTSVNGEQPDSEGNVNLTIVKEVQGFYPNEEGQIQMFFNISDVNGNEYTVGLNDAIITCIYQINTHVNLIGKEQLGHVYVDDSTIHADDGGMLEVNCLTEEQVKDKQSEVFGLVNGKQLEEKVEQFTAHKVAVCGKNTQYMLSDIYDGNSSVFVQLPYFDNVKQISISKSHRDGYYSANNSFVLSEDGTLYVSGYGDAEENCLGIVINQNSLIYYNHKIFSQKLRFNQVSMGGSIVGALDENNKLYICGAVLDYFYQQVPEMYFSDKTWKQIETGGSYMGGIDENDDLYLWFGNKCGQIGNGGENVWVDEPYLVDGSKKWRKLILPFGLHRSIQYDNATTHAIDSNGHLYGWGANYSGELGNGTIYQQQLTPLLIDDTHNYIEGSAGYGFVILIDSNGHLYGCGNNDWGQLGLGDTNDRNVITLIDDTKTWKKVCCGGFHTLLIDSNGHLYGCGLNSYGQLGLGDTNERNVITLIDDSKVYTDISCSLYSSMVVYEKQVCRDSMYTQKAIYNQEEIPVGTIITSAVRSGDVPGYLICNGAAVSRTTYKRLFEVIGTTYGTGDGSTTFNLPNLIDKFIMGSTSAGTGKAAGLPNITGGFTTRVPSNHTNYAVGAFTGGSGTSTSNITTAASYSGSGTGTWQDTYRYGFVLDASKSSSIYGKSTTVQPPALTMKFYIKY